jgi:hypothetical protein
MEKPLAVLAIMLTAFLLCLTRVNNIPVPNVTAAPIPEGCMIYSMAMQSSLNARAILDERCYWSEILAIKFKDYEIYHAVLVYEYLGGTWIYDCNLGSFKISNKKEWNAKKIAHLAYDDTELTIEDCFWVWTKFDHHDAPVEE